MLPILRSIRLAQAAFPSRISTRGFSGSSLRRILELVEIACTLRATRCCSWKYATVRHSKIATSYRLGVFLYAASYHSPPLGNIIFEATIPLSVTISRRQFGELTSTTRYVTIYDTTVSGGTVLASEFYIVSRARMFLSHRRHTQRASRTFLK